MNAMYGAFAIVVAIATSSFAHPPIDQRRDNHTSARLLHSMQQADSGRLVISEILFNPAEGDAAFVELLHVGERPVQLTDFILQIDTVVLPLPRLTAPLVPGTRVLIRFDGTGTIEDNVVHTSPGFELKAEGGTVSIRGNDDYVFDEIAWGDAPDAFIPTIGGLALREVERGSSFGRPPSANRAGAHSDWVVYAPDAVTPGQPNPLPPVAQLIPAHGAILEGTSTELMWYPVPGAVRYRVQLARDTTFAQTLLNATVADTKISTGQLQAGEYWWRVQAMQADGASAPWSRPSLIELGSAIDGGPAGGDGPIDGEITNAAVLLNVPLIMQHKDTKMLHLESLQEGRPRTGGLNPRVPHAWDRDHGTLDKDDPADNMNCTLASLAMMNRYYGGDMSQDRIGYEVWSRNIANYRSSILAPANAALASRLFVKPGDFREPRTGPERDLHFAVGMPWGRLMAAGMFALGSLPSDDSGVTPPFGALSIDDIWLRVKTEIDNRRPVLASVPGHAIVLRGYEQRGSRRLIHVNDPWHGRYALNVDVSASGPMATALQTLWIYPSARRQSQEPEVTKDTDSDGVVDFDETQRFRTNPANRDSDGDGVGDKQDIASGVYEAEKRFGYAYNPSSSKGRDYDFDGQPTELDPDSDNGGCKDGEEDVNADGERAGVETGNFDQTDDVCGNLQGSLSYLIEAINTDPNQVGRVGHDQAVILVKLKPESPGSRHYLDAGSTYSYQGYARSEVVAGNCTLWGLVVGRDSGPFTTEGAEIGGYRAENDTLTFDALASIPARVTSGGCLGSEELPGERTLSWPECAGALVPNAPGAAASRVYRFNCTTKPDLGPGWTVTRFYARGFVRVN